MAAATIFFFLSSLSTSTSLFLLGLRQDLRSHSLPVPCRRRLDLAGASPTGRRLPERHRCQPALSSVELWPWVTCGFFLASPPPEVAPDVFPGALATTSAGRRRPRGPPPPPVLAAAAPGLLGPSLAHFGHARSRCSGSTRAASRRPQVILLRRRPAGPRPPW